MSEWCFINDGRQGSLYFRLQFCPYNTMPGEMLSLQILNAIYA